MKALIFLTGLLASVASLAQAPSSSSDQRVLIAYLKVQPGSEKSFLKSAEAVIAATKKEPGNLLYTLHQSVSDPQQFVFYELFKSHADLEAHRTSKHVVAFLKEVNPIVIPGKFTLEEYAVTKNESQTQQKRKSEK